MHYIGYSLKRIAEELGLSRTTVSLVLNGKAKKNRISEDVEKKVKDFCKEVNYIPNIHAQRINRKFSGNIGFLVNQNVRVDFDNPFDDYNINGIIGGIVRAAEKRGYKVILQLYVNGMKERKVFDWFRNREIDALIYYGIDIPDNWRQTFIDEGHCVVGIGTLPDENILSINTDNFEASAKITKYLIDSGRKKYMYLSGVDNSFVSDERKRGFLSTLKENGIQFDSNDIIKGEFSEAIAEKKIKECYKDADAIVCANDDMAIGALRALKSLNVDVPGQVAVTGGDNIMMSAYVSPSITTFSNNQYKLGEAAVETAIKKIEGRNAENVILLSDMIIREST